MENIKNKKLLAVAGGHVPASARALDGQLNLQFSI
jgi:hypothetical protein